MRLRPILIPPALTVAGVLALGACSKAPELSNTSTGNATGTSVLGTTPGSDTSIDLGTNPDDPANATGDASTGGNTGNGNTGGNTGNGNTGGGATGTAPSVTGASGPATVNCPTATSMVAFTAHFTTANAKYVEYLSPDATRPGAGPANGSVMLNYNCAKPSEVFKIRAFNEFNGPDSKDPSPYVSFTVTRKLATPTTSSSSTSTTKAPTGTVPKP
jgi:hypothetical protein